MLPELIHLPGPLGHGGVEEHQGVDELVISLLGPPAQELDQLPSVGWIDTEPTV